MNAGLKVHRNISISSQTDGKARTLGKEKVGLLFQHGGDCENSPELRGSKGGFFSLIIGLGSEFDK